MKSIAFFLVLVLFTATTFSQDQTHTKEAYLQKSKQQKTTGIVLVSVGTGLMILGPVLAGNVAKQENLGFGPDFESGVLLFTAGIGLDLISIPVFISSAKNARKAAKISFNPQRIPLLQHSTPVVKAQPAITLRIGL